MRIAGLPNTRDQRRDKHGKRPARSFDRETQQLVRQAPENGGLLLDDHTLRDLEVFETAPGGRSLFNFCNRTQTEGGAKILRQRMEVPWSTEAQIRTTQESILFITKNRDVFAKLPAYRVQGVENYQREILLMVDQEGTLEFFIGALGLWVNHDRHYQSMVRGVALTCGIIRSMRRFLGQAELDFPSGELKAFISEMRSILARPNLQLVPDTDASELRPWSVMRLDQHFRSHDKGAILRLLKLIYEIDALVAMADVTASNNFILPEIGEGSLAINAEDLFHPYLDEAVANPVELNQQARLLFLTGPNMAGKTTYLRASAIAIYFAHMGMGVPARQFSFVPVNRMFSAISLNDDLYSGVSYFRAEALRVKAVAAAIAEGRRVVALMDEPFKGTNVKDAYDASLAIVTGLSGKENSLFMFSSHLIELDEELQANDQIKRCHFAADEEEDRLKFDYCLRDGVSGQRLGVRVLREEGVFELLGISQQKEIESSSTHSTE